MRAEELSPWHENTQLWRRLRAIFPPEIVTHSPEQIFHFDESGLQRRTSTIAVGPIGQTLSPEGERTGEAGRALEQAFPRFADDLVWWIEAAKAQRQRKQPPY